MIKPNEIQDLLRRNAGLVLEVKDVEKIEPTTFVVGPEKDRGLYRVNTTAGGEPYTFVVEIV